MAAPEVERPRIVRGTTHRGRSARTRNRISIYAKTQKLFRKNPSRLADLVLQDTLGELLHDSPRVDPPAEASIALYQNLWDIASNAVPDQPVVPPRPDVSVLPITPSELQARARRLRPGTASGLYGVTVQCLRNYPSIFGTLAVISNIVLFRGVYPAAWKSNRTTLIWKAGKDLTKSENWRPITISSLLTRLFSRVLRPACHHT